MSARGNYWIRVNRTIGRRRFLAGTAVGGAGLAGIGLVGCGDDNSSSNNGGSSSTTSGNTPKPTTNLTTPVDTTAQATKGTIVPQYTLANPPHLDLQLDESAPVLGTVGIVYDTLLEPKPGHLAAYAGEIQAGLAETWELSDPITLVLHLRQNAKWDSRSPTNSRALDSEDVLKSWDNFKDRNTYKNDFNGALNDLAPIFSMQAPDPKTVVVKLPKPNALLYLKLSSLASSSFHITPKEAYAGGFDPRQAARGTGPFVLDSFQSNVQATFRKNPNYWRADRPFVDGFDNHIITEYAQQLAQYTAGKIWNSPVASADILDIKGQVPALQVLQSDRGLASNRLWFGIQPTSPFRDQRVRQGAAMLIDRKLLQDTFYSVPAFEKAGYPVDRKIPTIGIVPYYENVWLNPETNDYTAAQKKIFEFHPDEAKKLLDASGVKLPIEMNLGYSKGRYGATYDGMAEAIVGMLNAQNYFKFTLTHIDYTTDWIPKFVAGKGNAPFPFFTPNANLGSPSALKYSLDYFYHTGALQNTYLPGAAAQVDGTAQGEAFLEKAFATLDLKEQTSILQDWQRFNATQCPSFDEPGPGIAPFILNWPWVMNARVWLGNATWSDWTEKWIDTKKLKELGYG